MSDLSVLEVQKHLRAMAEKGHDVLSNRHTVNFLGKDYGLVVNHGLWVHNGGVGLRPGDETSATLESSVLQTERPLISLLNTTYNDLNDKSKASDKFAQSVFPMYGMYFPAKTYPYHEDETSRYESSWKGNQEYRGRWELNDDTTSPKYKSAHEALEHHKTMEIGTHLEGFTKHRAFNNVEALKNHVRLGEPFDNKIRVFHHSGTYLYHPDTEEMHKVMG